MSVIPGLRLRWMRWTGALPKTSKMEAKRRVLQEEYARFQEYRSSDAYARFETLQAEMERGDTSNAREYKSLLKSRELRKFQQQSERGVFKELEGRKELFFDDFDGSSLDKQRWITKFFWGEALLGRPYSLSTDPQCYTDGQNVRLSNGRMVIETRAEQKESLCWDSKLGMMRKQFDYTSGVVCSGSSFRMPYGRIEVKVRFHFQPGVYHALYLVGNRMSPQLDVFRTDPNDGRLVRGVYSEGELQRDGNVEVHREEEAVGRLPFSSEFFILAVEWNRAEVSWSVNGYPYMTRKISFSGEPMYLVFASGIAPGAVPSGTAAMEVDWVRCLSPQR